MELLIGSHIGFDKNTQLMGVVEETIKNKANVFMFYTGSNQNTMRFPIDEEKTKKAHELMKENNIDIDNCIVHAPFIVNLANNIDEVKYNFYISFLRQEIDRCISLGINKIVLHPGSHVSLTKEEGIKNIINGLNIALKDKDKIIVLLEFMAGKGTEIGSSIDELKAIIDGIEESEKVGVCLDTCHMNDSGIDINKFEEFLDEFDKKIGIHRIKCVHLNDSMNPIGAHKDRHANIGYGTIGFDTLINVAYSERLKDIPKLLETPYKDGNSPYKHEIELIRNKEFKPLD